MYVPCGVIHTGHWVWEARGLGSQGWWRLWCYQLEGCRCQVMNSDQCFGEVSLCKWSHQCHFCSFCFGVGNLCLSPRTVAALPHHHHLLLAVASSWLELWLLDLLSLSQWLHYPPLRSHLVGFSLSACSRRTLLSRIQGRSHSICCFLRFLLLVAFLSGFGNLLAAAADILETLALGSQQDRISAKNCQNK